MQGLSSEQLTKGSPGLKLGGIPMTERTLADLDQLPRKEDLLPTKDAERASK
jgi:hypothetical protein